MIHPFDCNTARGILAEQVAAEAPATGELARHLAVCSACALDDQELRAGWEQLPALEPLRPPQAVRERILAYAGRAVGAPERVLGGLWGAVRELAIPVAWGSLAALFTVLLLHVRGAVAPVGTAVAATASLALAGALALVLGGLARAATPGPVRTVLLASAGALAGYVVLSLALPLPSAFEFCGVVLFRGAAMSFGQICLIHLVLAAGYAAIPLALAAYAASGRSAGLGIGLAEGGVFAGLGAPVLLLQVGLDQLMITATVIIGLVAGALLGGLAGAWVRGVGLVSRFT